MDLLSITAIVVTLSALFGYLNVRLLKLPNTIGLMVIAIVFTLLLIGSSYLNDNILVAAESIIAGIDFEAVLMQMMLGFLLFAGAMHTNFDQLKVQRWPVLLFATLGVTLSTFLVGTIMYFVFGWLGYTVQYIHCLLFGALISPTDPIAVLGILKKAGVPKKLETKIVGESLFNDGVGVVVFLTILSVAGGGHGHGGHAQVDSVGQVTNVALVQSDPAGHTSHSGSEDSQHEHEDHGDSAAAHADAEGVSVVDIVQLFVKEVLGGILFGLAIGYLCYLLMKSIDDYEIEVLITLACVMGGYTLAFKLGLSAPLAMVVAGLMVGNDTMRNTSMSEQTERYVDQFWEVVDMLMNAVLFVLIGLEVLILNVEIGYVYAALISIVVVLGCRFVSLLLPVSLFRKSLEFVPHTTKIMTWGGLRGGISIALALSLPTDLLGQTNKDLILTVTYGVVVFSIIVQGLSVGKLANHLIGTKSKLVTKENS